MANRLMTSRIDTIFLHQLQLMARIGILAHEKIAPQPILLDIELSFDTRHAGTTGNLADTLDYAQLADDVATLCLQDHIDLVETLAERLASYCLSDLRVQQVMIQLGKPQALTNCANVGVKIWRQQADFVGDGR